MTTRLLILEPDEALLDSYVRYLQHFADFELVGTTSADECIQQLSDFSPDVLLLEPALPPGEGDRVLEAIGNLKDQPFLPVVVLTFSNQEADKSHPNIQHAHVKPQPMKEIARVLGQFGQPDDAP